MWERLAPILLLAGCQALGSAGGPLAASPGDASGAVGLEGRIRDSAGAPVAGAQVLAYRPRLTVAGRLPSAHAEATTGPDGRFAINDPPRGILALEAIAGEARVRVAGLAFGDEVRGIALGDLRLAPAGALSGRVALAASPAAGTTLLGTEVELLGTDRVSLADEAGKFAFPGLAAGSYQVRARRPRLISAISATVAVAPGGHSEAAVLDLLPDAPVLSRVDPPNAGPGAMIRLSGRNFGTTATEPLVVSFGAMQAEAERESDGLARVRVPQGARSGPLAVVRDGVASDALAFPVVASISLQPTYAAVLPGERVRLVAAARDTEGLPIANPALSFAGGGPEWAAAPAAGFFEVSGASGLVRAAMWIAAGTARVSTLAGDGTRGSDGDGGPARAARLDTPREVVAGPDGTVYIAETGARKIRAVAPDGTIRTVASGLAAVGDLAVAAGGDLYYLDQVAGSIRRLVRMRGTATESLATGALVGVAIGPEGQTATATATESWLVGSADRTTAAELEGIACLAFGGDGMLYAATSYGGIWRIAGGSAERIAGGGVARGHDVPARDAALGRISGLAAVGRDLYFVDQAANLVRKLTAAGRVSTVAGDGHHGYGTFGRFNGDGLALGASFNVPAGLCALPGGDLAIADTQNHRVRVLRP